MTEREFLDAQSRRIRARLRRRSTGIHDRLEDRLGPIVREHPRTALAVGASAGLLLGGLLGPALRSATSRERQGFLRGTADFVRGTGVYALRTTLVSSILAALTPVKKEPTLSDE